MGVSIRYLPASRPPAATGAAEPVTEGPGGFEELFLAEYTRLVSVAYRVLANRAEAEDVAQEALWRFHRRYPNGHDRAAGWLHAAAAHLALNTLRSRRRREARELIHTRDIAPVTSSQDPEEAAQIADQVRRVRRAFAHLSGRSASVLALRYGGLSYAEVAEAMGVGVGQVGTILRRAEAALRKEVNRGTSE